MKAATRLMFVLVTVSLVSALGFSGNLEPPGPPAPTMFTLNDVNAKWRVPKTGQATCFDASGVVIGCAGTGQDGAYQAGVALVGPRFTDNNDGTVRDNLTGLIWLKNANCFGLQSWSSALLDANALASGTCSLTDGSTAGVWRLPNVRELTSLINYDNLNPALPAGHPFLGVVSDYCWVSTTRKDIPNQSLVVDLFDGQVNSTVKTNQSCVWLVRSHL